MTEDELIAAVIRIRTAGTETAKDVHAALLAEGMSEVSLSEVKKASSKATKKMSSPEFLAAAPTGTTTSAEGSMALSKKQEKAAKAAKDTMKSAEAFMMDMCRKHRMALGDDEYSAAVQTSDRGEVFIQGVVQRALESKLSQVEVLSAEGIRARIEADLAVLEWAIIAEKAGTLNLPEDARTTATRQIDRLKGIRGSNSLQAAEGCFIVEPPPAPEPTGPASGIEYSSQNTALHPSVTTGSIDRLVAKSGMLAKGAMGFDDDMD